MKEDVKTNISEEEIVLAPPTELFDEAKDIAQNTTAEEKFPFTLQYDANQKEFLLSQLQTAGAIVEDDDEEGHVLATMMNMTQLAFIKRLDCVERVRTDEGLNPFLAEEAVSPKAVEAETPVETPVETVAQQNVEPAQTEQVMTLAADESVAVATEPLAITAEPVAATADDGIAVACVGGSSSSCCCPTNKDMASAQEIEVEKLVSGKICCPGAEQWFKFTVPQTASYTIYTTGSLDTVGALYDCCGNLMVEIDDYAPCGKINFRIIRYLTANTTYYLRVTEAKSDTGSYSLRVTQDKLVNYVTVSPSTIVLEKGKSYELPITPNYTYLNLEGTERITNLSVSLSPAKAAEQLVYWYGSGRDVISTESGWLNGQRYQKLNVIGDGTATLYAYDWDDHGKRGECTVTVVGSYEKQLQDSCAFSSEEAKLIRGLYDKIDAVFFSESNLLKAWRYARFLSEFYYDYPTSVAGITINRWDDVAGSVTMETDRKEYYMKTFGYTEIEYNKLRDGLLRNHEDANTQNNIIDFTHMQFALAARLAYTLNKDGVWSNLGTGLYTGNYGVYTDEEISYLGGWFGDAILTNMYGEGQTILKNDDYMADLDAENVYRFIIQGKAAIDALEEYYFSITTSSNNRADIFLQNISYSVVKEKIFYELIDAELNMYMINASNQGNIALVNYYLDLINDEAYHFNRIQTDYPDTYDFLKSLENRLMTMAHFI